EGQGGADAGAEPVRAGRLRPVALDGDESGPQDRRSGHGPEHRGRHAVRRRHEGRRIMTPLSIAFVPLTDSAVVVAAREKGFAEAEGLDLTLVKCTSWATVRDRLVFGQVQAAHMLAPLAVAVTLGLSQHPARIVAPYRLGMNGNALTLATDFAAALDPKPANRINDPVATAHDFVS